MELSPCLVTVASIQGSRTTYEDRLDVSASFKNDVPYIFCGIFDGHGGSEASRYLRDYLLPCIECQSGFMSHDDFLFTKAIRNGFRTINRTMKAKFKDIKLKTGTCPKSGSTASIVIIARNKAYIAYVGDSPIYVIQKKPDKTRQFSTIGPLHDIDHFEDYQSIINRGGEICMDSHNGHEIRSSTNSGALRMTRSLGDFWLCNDDGRSILSCEPRINVVELDEVEFIVITSDGINFTNKKEFVKTIVNSQYQDLNPAHSVINTLLGSSKSLLNEYDNASIICMSFMKQKVSTLKAEIDCSTHGIGKAIVVCFNNQLTSNPLNGIYFYGNKVYLKIMNKPVIMSTMELMKNYAIQEPGYVNPKTMIDEDVQNENAPPEARKKKNTLLLFRNESRSALRTIN